MKRIVKTAGFVIAALLVVSCTSVMVTGRKQLNLVSDEQTLALGLQSYNEFMSTAKLSNNQQQAQLVKRAGKKLSSAVVAYMKSAGMENEIQNYSWEFDLVQSPEVNAFCMPGGKIVFYEGIMPYCNDETLVAVVMSHEIAHAVAKHSNERLSQQMMAQFGSAFLDGVLSNQSSGTRTMAQSVYGLGAQFGVMLPYSRKQEYEADKLGLIFMALCGYNINRAVEFWENMAQVSKSSTPEFMSTHPSDEARIEAIKKVLPEARKYMPK